MTDIWWAGDSPVLQNLTVVLQVIMLVWYNHRYNWGMENSRRLDDETVVTTKWSKIYSLISVYNPINVHCRGRSYENVKGLYIEKPCT